MLDELQHAKVCDFGLSRDFTAKAEALQLGFQSVSHTTGHVGTLRYLAPEALRWFQTTSAKDVKIQYNERCDVYSFALLLWELTHREPPFNGVDATQVALDVAPSGQRPELRLPKGLKPLGGSQLCNPRRNRVSPKQECIILLSFVCCAENLFTLPIPIFFFFCMTLIVLFFTFC